MKGLVDGLRGVREWPVSLAGSHLLLLTQVITYDELVWGGSICIGVTLVATGLRPGLVAKGYLNWDAQHGRGLLSRGTIGRAATLITVFALAIAAVLGRTNS